MGEKGFSKKCPDCGCEQMYTLKSNWLQALKKGQRCRRCSAINRGGKYEFWRTKYGNDKADVMIEAAKRAQSKRVSGPNNPNYGKTISVESRARISAALIAYSQTEAFKGKDHSKQGNPGSKNPMFGRSVYSVWVEKYGVEEADRRHAALRAKQSRNNSGSGNPMYGKPAPQGAGNGWKGWIDGHFFRSLGELNFFLTLEKDGEQWVTGEFVRIPYTDALGVTRTYSPDFITDTEVIECKPEALHKAPSVQAKAVVGKIWAKGQGLKYKLVDPGKPTFDTTKKLVENGRVVWMPVYEKKFTEWLALNAA